MILSSVAARVMSLTGDGQVDEALELGQRALVESTAATPTEQAALWYAMAGAQLLGGAMPGVLTSAERCVALAVEADSSGWASAGLSLRAMALARQGRMEPALLDLARAEAELLGCRDAGLRCWAHTGLGYSYLELRLYELAQPHLERAQELEASPIPLPESPTIDLVNLAELHVRWADELERVRPYIGSDDDVQAHRKEGHAYAERALACARQRGLTSLTATCRALELTSRPRGTAQASLEELREAFADEDPPSHQGSRVAVGGALARALWSLGQRREAVRIAREAVFHSDSVVDWQVAASAQWLLVELEAQSGVAGAAAGRRYAGLLSQVLWQQRLSTLQGAQAALQLERLHRDKELAQRAASEDPLTGISNRRALDDMLRSLQAEAAGPLRDNVPHPMAPGLAHISPESPVSLLVVDLNDFKQINDTYGHVVGDEVLRAVAMAMRGVARADDMVVRLGGDEFVVLARGADRDAGARLAGRVTAAIDALSVGTRDGVITLSASVGVATAYSNDDAMLLLAQADTAMYAVKADSRA